jgi:hypothetical protein
MREGIGTAVAGPPVSERAGRPRVRAWVGLDACAATLAALALKSMLPGLPGEWDYTAGFAPAWAAATAATLGAVAVLLMVAWPRLRVVPRRVVLAAGWTACVLLVWGAAGIVFDLLRAAAVLGIPGMPPIVDWLGLLTRATALAASVLLAAATVSWQRAFRDGCARCGRVASAGTRPTAWLGYTAVVLAFPYPLLKLYWALGGTLAVPGGDIAGHPAIGESIMLVGGAALSLALVQRWGRIIPGWVPVVAGRPVPRRLPLAAGWCVSGLLVTMGALAVFGSITQALGLVAGPARGEGNAWVVWMVYGSWLLYGLALGGATWAYQQQTRVRCAQCGR